MGASRTVNLGCSYWRGTGYYRRRVRTYLLQRGFLKRTPRRRTTRLGYRHCGGDAGGISRLFTMDLEGSSQLTPAAGCGPAQCAVAPYLVVRAYSYRGVLDSAGCKTVGLL